MVIYLFCFALGWVCFCSICSFVLCGWDKRCSKRKKARRIPEKTFFFWAAIGGALGLWLGMYTFRHKTKHWYFVWGIPAIALLQISILGAGLFWLTENNPQNWSIF